jgi:hypothetical protein
MAERVSEKPIAGIETQAQAPSRLMLATNPLPADIRVSDARLPATYEQAKAALAQCSRIDECQEWANKAEALASYARQADDDTLRKLADRIQGRAVRRCGELLKLYQTGPQGGRPKEKGTAPAPFLRRRPARTPACQSARSRRQRALPTCRPNNSKRQLRATNPRL